MYMYTSVHIHTITQTFIHTCRYIHMCEHKYAQTPHSRYSYVSPDQSCRNEERPPVMREGTSQALRIGAVCMDSTLMLRDSRLRILEREEGLGLEAYIGADR